MTRSSCKATMRIMAVAVLSLPLVLLTRRPLLAQELPLPVVQRTRPAEGYVFDRPSLIVIARIIAQVKSAIETDDPLEELTMKDIGVWTHVEAQVFEVLRVNERLAGEPDLAQGYFMLEQWDRRERPLPLELRHYYVLLLRPSTQFLPNWRPSENQLCCLPPYALAVPQGGFEILDPKPTQAFVGRGMAISIDGKLRPLVKGGPLDVYTGRPLGDLVKELRSRQ
jgi:hypothetical protein